MEDKIKEIFNKIISDPNDGDGPREAQEFLDSFYQDPQFFQSLFTIFRDTNETRSIRVMSIIILKLQFKMHWFDFSNEFQQVLLENIPELILGITTQEPQYHLFISDLTIVILFLSFDDYFKDFWADIISDFIMSDEDHFFSGLLLFINLYQVIAKKKYISDDEKIKAELITYMQPLFERITEVYAESNLNIFLKDKCIIAAISAVDFDPEICLEASFLPWYETVNDLTSEDNTFLLPYTKETATFLTNLIDLYQSCLSIFSEEEMPNSTELILTCFNIMFDSEWEDNSNQSLIIKVFNFFASFVNKIPASWEENFLEKFPDIIQNVYLPVFQLDPNSIQLVITDPMEFIIEYHVDDDSVIYSDNSSELESMSDDYIYNESITPMISASRSLRQISDKHPEIHDFLFSIPSTALTEFMSTEEKEFTDLYSVFHMVHSYWGVIVLNQTENAIEFMNELLPLFEETIESPDSISTELANLYLFQSSLLLIISRANPFKPHANVYQNEEESIKVNPMYVELSIELIDSESLLVRYFASFSLHNLLYCYDLPENDLPEYDKEIMNVCLPHALKVIINIIEYTREYGKTKLANIIIIFLKNKEILKSIIEHTPDLIESVFSIASSIVESSDNLDMNSHDLEPIISSLINMINQLDDYPNEQELLCKMIFKKCIDAFSIFKYYELFYQLIAIILVKSPNYIHELYNLIFPQIISIFPISKLFAIDISKIFHVMMIRSPDFMLLMNSKSLQSIINDVDDDDNSCANSLFEIGSLIIDGCTEYVECINIYYSSLLYLIPFDDFPVECIYSILDQIKVSDENELSGPANYYYDSCVDILLMLLKYNARMFYEIDDGVMLNVYLDLFEVIDVGCALAFADEFVDLDVKKKIIANILESPDKISDVDDSNFVDDKLYEMEMNLVDPKVYYFRIFSNQQKLDILKEYLRNLDQNDPDVADIFDNYRENLDALLDFSFQDED